MRVLLQFRRMVIEIAGARHHGVSHNHMVDLGRNSPEIIINTFTEKYKLQSYKFKMSDFHSGSILWIVFINQLKNEFDLLAERYMQCIILSFCFF